MGSAGDTSQQLMKNDEFHTIFQFVLYIAGESASGQRAYQNLRSICDEYVPGKYSIDIVDLEAAPEIAVQEQVLAVPMVVKKAPLPEVRIIGDLSDREKVLEVLGIERDSSASQALEKV